VKSDPAARGSMERALASYPEAIRTAVADVLNPPSPK
jgi:hypothetical protein